MCLFPRSAVLKTVLTAAAAEWVRWEGGVLTCNQAAVRRAAPVIKTREQE